MNLTFTSGRYYSWTGRTDSDLELFTINPSTRRGDDSVNLRCQLPGATHDVRVEPAAPVESYEATASARTAAIALAGQVLRAWASKHLGVDLDVNVIDNT